MAKPRIGDLFLDIAKDYFRQHGFSFGRRRVSVS